MIITDEKLKMCEEILKNKINDQSMDYEQNALRILEIAYAIGSDLGEDSINKIIDAYFDVVLNQQVRLSPESNSKAEEQLE